MPTDERTWVQEFPAEVMLCDPDGIILAMNLQAEDLFASEGGAELVGKNLLDCHPEPARSKLAALLASPVVNTYFSTENGEKRFFFQAPFTRQGRQAGLVEISFAVPEDLPHFVRGQK